MADHALTNECQYEICSGSKATLAVKVDRRNLKPTVAKDLVMQQLKEPVVFTNMIGSWTEALSWTPEELAQLLSGITTSFKICPRDTQTNKVVFENECIHVLGSYKHLCKWLCSNEPPLSEQGGKEKNIKTVTASTSGSDNVEQTSCDDGQTLNMPEAKRSKIVEKCDRDQRHNSNPLMTFSRDHYCIYAAYKYMSELCEDRQAMKSAVDWSVFGFSGRNGEDSTLWVGSEGASTPCHYDSYGCNLVAQLQGRKRWVLFPPSGAECLYPTRLPFEESSVFSRVNVGRPNLNVHPKFALAQRYEVVLEAGQVLYVPRHWWHHVECVSSAAVSVNTWIDLPQDNKEKLKESLTRLMVCALKGAETVDLNARTVSTESELSQWLNPGEEVFSHSTNLKLVSMAMDGTVPGDSFHKETRHVSMARMECEQQNNILIDAIADSRVTDLLSKVMQEKLQDSILF